MKMVWSPGTIKNVHSQVEEDMQQTMVKFDVAAIFEYIIEKFGLSEKK
jgi:hypothetical protein